MYSTCKLIYTSLEGSKAPSSSVFAVFAGVGLFEVLMDNEERDLWRSFLERGDYASASRYASTQVGTFACNK